MANPRLNGSRILSILPNSFLAHDFAAFDERDKSCRLACVQCPQSENTPEDVWMTAQTRRALRLLEVERLLRRAGDRGMSTSELAAEIGCSVRTIQRDLGALEVELRVPLTVEGRRWRILKSADPLAPLHLNLHEARALLFALRLFLRYADEQDPDAISAVKKLADVLWGPLQSFVQLTSEQLSARPHLPTRTEVLRTLTEGWARSRCVEILYRHGGALRVTNVEPHLLEPTATGLASYVIGRSSLHGAIRTFKLDRIESARLTEERFDPPDIQRLIEQMSRSWSGIVLADDEIRVTIDFAPSVAERVRETFWHPSQILTPLENGGVRLELLLPSTLEFVPWVRSWGHDAIVREPEELRLEVARSFALAAANYASSQEAEPA